jgi:hypothetical protein
MAKRLRYTIEALLVNALILSTLYQLLVYLANRRFWRQAPLPPAENPDPSVSVIVPMRGKTLDTLALLHLIAITSPTPHYEVILALEDERDPAYPLAEEIVEVYPGTARIVLSGPAGRHVGKIHNLNAGYRAAHGDLIAFVDADVQVSAELWNAALAVKTDRRGVAPPLPERAARRRRSLRAAKCSPRSYQPRADRLPFAALNRRTCPAALCLHRCASGRFVVSARPRRRRHQPGPRRARDRLPDSGIPVPALVPDPKTSTRRLPPAPQTDQPRIPPAFLAWPFTNPLTVGFMLGFITEHEGRWWGRRTWWFFIWLRMAIAYELDRIRFGRGFTWIAYAQLLMLDTFIAPALWARALFQQTFVWRGRTYRITQGGRATPLD